MGLYDWYLGARVRNAAGEVPETVSIVITEQDLLEQGAYDRLGQVLHWAFEYDAESVLVYVSVLDDRVIPTLERELKAISTPEPVAVRGPTDDAQAAAPIQVSIGHGGKHEFTQVVRSLAADVAAGDLEPADISEAEIEAELVFPDEPDLVIKTGAERLSDFLIWQSVYSELYFTDVNWRNFRKRDYLRAVLDYMDRQRRFGT